MLSSVRCEIALFSLIADAFRASGVWSRHEHYSSSFLAGNYLLTREVRGVGILVASIANAEPVKEKIDYQEFRITYSKQQET